MPTTANKLPNAEGVDVVDGDDEDVVEDANDDDAADDDDDDGVERTVFDIIDLKTGCGTSFKLPKPTQSQTIHDSRVSPILNAPAAQDNNDANNNMKSPLPPPPLPPPPSTSSSTSTSLSLSLDLSRVGRSH